MAGKKTAWNWIVCFLMGHRGPVTGGPFAQTLHCERCGRDLRIGVD